MVPMRRRWKKRDREANEECSPPATASDGSERPSLSEKSFDEGVCRQSQQFVEELVEGLIQNSGIEKKTYDLGTFRHGVHLDALRKVFCGGRSEGEGRRGGRHPTIAATILCHLP